MRAPTAHSTAMRAPAPRMATIFTKKTFFIAAPFVGNMGFDPLQLAKPERLAARRHAEVKHGRLAMIGAAAWPAQELVHPTLAQIAGSKNVLDQTGGLIVNMDMWSMPEASPAYAPRLPMFFSWVVCGGAARSLLTPFAACMHCARVRRLALALVIGAIAELQDMNARMSAGLRFNEFAPDSVAGDIGFDPLNLATELGVTDRYELQEAEIINGRLAMISLLSFCAIEATTGTRIVDVAPSFF